MEISAKLPDSNLDNWFKHLNLYCQIVVTFAGSIVPGRQQTFAGRASSGLVNGLGLSLRRAVEFRSFRV
jgi:hypothetical protein